MLNTGLIGYVSQSSGSGLHCSCDTAADFFSATGIYFFWYSYGMDLYISKHISRENAHLERKFTMKIDVIS